MNRLKFVFSLGTFLLLVCNTACSQDMQLRSACDAIRDGDFVTAKNIVESNKNLIKKAELDPKTQVTYNLLSMTILKGDRSFFDYLIVEGADVAMLLPGKAGYTPAFYAATVTDSYFLTEVLRLGADPDALASDGYSMLHYALIYNCLDNAKLLLKAMTTVETWKGVTDNTALIFAALSSGRAEAVRFVVEHGFTLDAHSENGYDPVEYLFQQTNKYLRQDDILKYLADIKPELVMGRMLALHCLRDKWKNPYLLITLQSNGFDVLNEKDTDGNTVLVYLLKAKEYRVISGLVEQGLRGEHFNAADLNIIEYMERVLGYTDVEIAEYRASFGN